MSEKEELEKGVHESVVNQRIDALKVHFAYLETEIDTRYARKKDSAKIYMVAWAAWLISAFFGDPARYLMICIFLGTVFYDDFRYARLQRIFGEFDGTIATLRILGMVPPEDERGEKKKRSVWNFGMDLVKGWATKKKAQEKVYAPA